MKNFLVCPICGHHNDAHSEYLTFCESCKKKLSNNFHDWQKQHPESTLNDFFREVCIDENESKKQNQDIAQKSERKAPFILGNPKIIIALAVFLVVVGLAIISINNLMNSARKFEAISLIWSSQVYGDYGLFIDSPVRMDPFTHNVPQSAAISMEDMQAFASDPNKEFSMIVISTKFKRGFGPVNAEASISNFVYQIKAMPGITELKVDQNETTIGGIPGFEQHGSFLNNGIPVAFRSIGITEGVMLWQVMVIYLKGDKRLEEARDRVFDSLEIRYNNTI